MDLNEVKEVAGYLSTEFETIGFVQDAQPTVSDLGTQIVDECEAHVFEATATLVMQDRMSIKYTLRLSQGIYPGRANTVQIKIETGDTEPIEAYRSDAGHKPRTHKEILTSIIRG